MIYLIGDRTKRVVSESAQVCFEGGCPLSVSVDTADVIIAPWLDVKIPAADLAKTKHGALVFHPSLLPLYRGRNAIKDAFSAGEKTTGATWFWANDRFDAGEICEQMPLAIKQGEGPREFYDRAVVPAAIYLLRYILRDLRAGIIRRRPQMTFAATGFPPDTPDDWNING